MSQTIDDQQAATPVLKLLYSPIEAEMAEVEMTPALPNQEAVR